MKRACHVVVVAFLLSTILASCAPLGVPEPETFNQKVAAAQIAVTGVRSATLDLLRAGQISAKDAQNMQDHADVGRKSIDVARQIYATDPAAADARLSAAIAALEAARAYLRSRGGKP